MDTEAEHLASARTAERADVVVDGLAGRVVGRVVGEG
jgi:hypothetical protein